MRLGQWCYWIEDERPITGPALVRIRAGRHYRTEGDTTLVMVPIVYGERRMATEILLNVHLFTQRDVAECTAIGRAVRLVHNFKFSSASAYDEAGTVLFTYPVPEPKG